MFKHAAALSSLGWLPPVAYFYRIAQVVLIFRTYLRVVLLSSWRIQKYTLSACTRAYSYKLHQLLVDCYFIKISEYSQEVTSLFAVFFILFFVDDELCVFCLTYFSYRSSTLFLVTLSTHQIISSGCSRVARCYYNIIMVMTMVLWCYCIEYDEWWWKDKTGFCSQGYESNPR